MRLPWATARCFPRRYIKQQIEIQQPRGITHLSDQDKFQAIPPYCSGRYRPHGASPTISRSHKGSREWPIVGARTRLYPALQRSRTQEPQRYKILRNILHAADEKMQQGVLQSKVA